MVRVVGGIQIHGQTVYGRLRTNNDRGESDSVHDLI